MGKPVGALEEEKKGERPSEAVCVCVCVCVRICAGPHDVHSEDRTDPSRLRCTLGAVLISHQVPPLRESHRHPLVVMSPHLKSHSDLSLNPHFNTH